jgi:PTS system nitrogen regulatory IIA component
MLTDFLSEDKVIADLAAQSKVQVMEELCKVLMQSNPDLDLDKLMGVLIERERLGSTGIGDGIAIPHGKSADLDHLLISFGRSRQGVDFDSLDGKPAHLFFLVLAPENSAGVHLKALARISRLLKSHNIRSELMKAGDAAAIYSIFASQDEDF